MYQVEFKLKSRARGCHLVTTEIMQNIKEHLPEAGMLNLFIKHTSAALSINENADPDVRSDMSKSLDKLVPENAPYYDHTLEGPDDMPAHIKCSMIGASINIPISNHHLNMGIWQGIYLCEFRNNGGQRSIVATIW